MRWLRRLWTGCWRGHLWLPPVWTGHDWIHVCMRGCIKRQDETPKVDA